MQLHESIRTSHVPPEEAGLRGRLGRAVVPLALICLMVYFAYHAVQGDHGLMRLVEKREAREAIWRELADARAVREALERDVALLRLGSLDPDLLDERARAALGYAHPDELVVFIDE